MQVVQTLLRQGAIERVAFLPVDPRVKVGSVISLKDDLESGQWEVAEQYAKQDFETIHRHWGLDLPKSQRTER